MEDDSKKTSKIVAPPDPPLKVIYESFSQKDEPVNIPTTVEPKEPDSSSKK